MGWWFPFYGAFFHGIYQQPVDAGDRGRLDGVDVELLEEPEGRSVGPLGLPLFCRAAQPWSRGGRRDMENVRKCQKSNSLDIQLEKQAEALNKYMFQRFSENSGTTEEKWSNQGMSSRLTYLHIFTIQ